jgi:hypothetical protein
VYGVCIINAFFFKPRALCMFIAEFYPCLNALF